MNNLFDKISNQEKEFFSSQFLSPVLANSPVKVRIAGIVMEFDTSPKKFQGWGIFETKDRKTATLVREATKPERKNYLDLYPRFKFAICKQGKQTLGFPLNQQDSRLSVTGIVPILLPEDTTLFQSINARFDGDNFWFESRDSSRSIRLAKALRDSLASETKPADVLISGLSPEEKKAYQFAYDFEIESKRDKSEDRVRDALTRAGAEYRSYIERGATYTVEFTVDGQRHRSTVDKSTLQVSSAGICLNGTDNTFDLQTLVTVIREAQDTGAIYRVGGNRG